MWGNAICYQTWILLLIIIRIKGGIYVFSNESIKGIIMGLSLLVLCNSSIILVTIVMLCYVMS